MKETHSGKAVSSHSKRKNVVLSLVFCVAAVCVALLVLVGPGHSLAGAAQRSGVDAALPASIDTTTSDNTAQPTEAPTAPPQPAAENINDFGGYPSAGDALGEIKISGTSVDCALYYGDEDAQLSFYAAMMAPDPVRVAYVNVGENGSTDMHELEGVQRQSRLLMRSLAYDLQRIADGQPLQALGQGARCDYCAMRGLCRRDFWMEEQA